MKFLLLLTIALVASGTNANFLSGLQSVFQKVGDAFSVVGKSLLGQLDNVGGVLFNQVKDAGKNLLSQGLQALALNTMGAFKGNKTTREISGLLQQVTKFEIEAKKVIENGVDSFKPVLANAISAFQNVIDNVENAIDNPNELVQTIDNIVGVHNGLADMIMKNLVSSLNNLVTKFFGSHKRNAFTDAITGFGSQLANFFKPLGAGFKNLISTTGTALKTAGTNMLETVKTSATQLGTKLAIHGLTALSALKTATTDIFKQTSDIPTETI
ncbi:uncharacterized protein LOC126826915 [Patella vulgata]|uniref:uncharacterized protein LOC126826915 n=1 Tax=Patella vulgata TaxID=6465 RepID=UPI0021808A92|nr:uncharacterized protein LOC126826915 [Patella vulgata]